MFVIDQYHNLIKYKGDAKDVVIPTGVQRIKPSAFGIRLNSVLLPETLLTIESWAFEGQDKIKEILIPDSVCWIGDRAFMDCTSLQQVRLPAISNYIGEKCFQNSGLKELMIPGGSRLLRYGAFSSCPELETIYIDDGVDCLTDTCFEFCPKLQKVTIPASVLWIGDYAFCGSKNVTLYVQKGSYAERYAALHDIPCNFITPKR